MVIGQVVKSKNGRDKGKTFIVLNIEGDYVYIADGKQRSMKKPKKKKARHIQHTSTVIDLGSVGPRGLCDADIRKFIERHEQKNNGVKGEG